MSTRGQVTQAIEYIKFGDLVAIPVDHNYQRYPKPAVQKRIKEDFVLEVFGVPIIHCYNRKKWIVDGQQRICAVHAMLSEPDCKKKYGITANTQVPVLVTYNSSKFFASVCFRKMQGRQVMGNELIKATLHGNDKNDPEVQCYDLVVASGYDYEFVTQGKQERVVPNGLVSLTEMRKIYNRGVRKANPKHICDVLRFLALVEGKGVPENVPEGLRHGRLLNGISRWFIHNKYTKKDVKPTAQAFKQLNHSLDAMFTDRDRSTCPKRVYERLLEATAT